MLFSEFDVQLTSVSDQWAQFSIAGAEDPTCSRRLSDPAEDLSNEGFPFHGRAQSRLRGGHQGAAVPHLLSRRDGVRDFRAGTLRRMPWRANLMLAGAPFGVTLTAPRRSA
ncbi:hypothetical protein ACFSQT_31960 [Mesorhizobium calcicola]|uniref:Uncharacterized protein n=1 Tax=Mesorhizobium calcicola TaxID=1300310 RepID=A0ABW4WNN2_9HYPH